ncbi:MAG: hypothetical protein WB615_14090 [Candidatus Tumulicola sp.]
MYWLSRLAGIAGCAAAVALSGCAESSVPPKPIAASSDWIDAGGVRYHRPHYALLRDFAAGRVRPDLPVRYNGGPVLVNPKVYLIFWDYKAYGDSNGVKKLLQQYAGHMGGSGHNNIYTQYYEVLGSSTIYIENPAKQYGGSWDDDSAIPKKPTDAQIAAEAIKGVKHFGYDPNGSYVVATAHGHSTSGFGSHWCAYHSSVSDGKNVVSYTDFPYMPDAGSECGANIITPPAGETGTDEGVTIMAGHEYGESITDPDPYSGWSGVDGEIGDTCAWHNIANEPFGKKSYATQPMFSNATQACVQSYP